MLSSFEIPVVLGHPVILSILVVLFWTILKIIWVIVKSLHDNVTLLLFNPKRILGECISSIRELQCNILPLFVCNAL